MSQNSTHVFLIFLYDTTGVASDCLYEGISESLNRFCSKTLIHLGTNASH